MQCAVPINSAAVPRIRVEPELRAEPESVLRPGETLDEFVEASVRNAIAFRRLAHAGPFDGVDRWRGLFILATLGLDLARKAAKTDPVIIKGEMVAEQHKHLGSAALLAANEWHPGIIEPKP